VLLGRGTNYFLNQILCLEKCRIEEPLPVVSEEVKKEDDEGLPIMETMMQNSVSVRLCDEDGKNFYISKCMVVIVVFSSKESDKLHLLPSYSTKQIVKTKDNVLDKQHKKSDYNEVDHLFQSAALNPGDNSLLEMKVAPEQEGLYNLHVYLVTGDLATEIVNSPIRVKIVISEIHKNKLKDKEMDAEQLRLEKMRLEELNKEKQRKRDEEKRLAKLSKEE
jgi:hypothetical protein